MLVLTLAEELKHCINDVKNRKVKRAQITFVMHNKQVM